MAKGRLTMRRTREILRQKWELWAEPSRGGGEPIGLSHGVVARTLARAASAALSELELGTLTDEVLEAKLYGQRAEWVSTRPLPDCAQLHGELRRAGVRLQLLHVEYLQANPSVLRSAHAASFRMFASLTPFVSLRQTWKRSLLRGARADEFVATGCA